MFEMHSERQLWTFNALLHRYRVVDVAFVDIIPVERVLKTAGSKYVSKLVKHSYNQGWYHGKVIIVISNSNSSNFYFYF